MWVDLLLHLRRFAFDSYVSLPACFAFGFCVSLDSALRFSDVFVAFALVLLEGRSPPCEGGLRRSAFCIAPRLFFVFGYWSGWRCKQQYSS